MQADEQDQLLPQLALVSPPVSYDVLQPGSQPYAPHCLQTHHPPPQNLICSLQHALYILALG